MKINPKDFCVPEASTVNLDKWPTLIKPAYKSKADYQEQLAAQTTALSELQQVHYAANQHAVLLIFQAMDAAGKDGAIKNVMSGINPQGCQVFSFKQPSVAELEHDFLWRTSQCLPERGQIGIFNRSYYEEVLIVRVHPEMLRNQGFRGDGSDEKALWKERYASIVDHEKHLHRNGTRIIKFFLHLSRDEQRKRFIERIDDPEKHWKFSTTDVQERKFWDQYMHAYEACMSATSTTNAPWHVVPADDKENARLIISQIVLETFKALKLSYPKTDAARRDELLALRSQLINEDAGSGSAPQ